MCFSEGISNDESGIWVLNGQRCKLDGSRAAAPSDTGEKTVFKILLTISFCHLLNDTIQSLMPPIYPLLQRTFHFNYWQVAASRSLRN